MKKYGFFFVLLLFFFVRANQGSAEEVKEEWVREDAASYNYYYASVGSTVVRADSQGNAYVTGTSEDFYRAYKTVKYDKNGNQVWMRKYGGTQDKDCYASAMIVDSHGDVYVTGACRRENSDFDIVTVKYDSGGNEAWSAKYGGQSGMNDLAFGLDVDGYGEVYVAGLSRSRTTGSDIITIKYNSTGDLSWASIYDAGVVQDPYYGAQIGHDYADAVSLDRYGNVYVAGVVKMQSTSSSNSENAVIKYDPAGNRLWIRTHAALGRAFSKTANRIAVDRDGNVYLFGVNVLKKYDANGNERWVKNFDGGYEKLYLPSDITVGPTGNVSITGNWAMMIWQSTTSSIYTAKYDPNGNLLWGAQYDGEPYSRLNWASALALDEGENVYITGYTLTAAGTWDYATVKYDPAGNMLWDVRYDGPGSSNGQHATSIAVDAAGNVYISGESWENSFWPSVVTVKYSQPGLNKPPVAKAGPDRTIECTGPEGAVVTLDGSGSTDPDDDSLTYTWTWGNNNKAEGMNPAVSLPLGAVTIVLMVDDGKGHTASDDVVITVKDTAPPSTSIALDGVVGNNDWYVSIVNVILTAADGCSAVKEIRYVLDGAEHIVSGDKVELTIGTDGMHALAFNAADSSGNSEQAKVTVIKEDKTPPEITVSASPAPNAMGWNNTDVTVTFTCTDALSGIAACTSPVTVAAEGAGLVVSGTAVDAAGNSASASATLNIDKTAPSANLSVSPGILWPPNHKMVDVLVGGGASDGTSGVASVVFTVKDEYGTIEPAITGFNTVISLEAWREGADKDGRFYTVTAVIMDKAGNDSTSSTTVLVPHDQR